MIIVDITEWLPFADLEIGQLVVELLQSPMAQVFYRVSQLEKKEKKKCYCPWFPMILSYSFL